MRSAWVAALAVSALAGCSGPEPEAAPIDPTTPAPEAAGNFPGRSYERNFVFAALTGDSVFLVPWLMETTTLPGTVVREADAWLARSGTWEGFYSATWETPPTRTPARVLPHGSFRIVVRDGDAIDGIIFDEGTRNLELALGNVLMQWGGPGGEVFQLLDGSLYLADQRLGGIVLDMARGSESDQPRGGDWAFLLSGDSLQVVLEGDAEHTTEQTPAYRAWARLDFRDLRWSEVQVDWGETQAFQPARRDVPVSWTITSANAELSGVLDVRSADIRPGTGDGPVLPLRALFEVSGSLVVDGRTFPVRGMFTHERR